jgi:hypothetical protein
MVLAGALAALAPGGASRSVCGSWTLVHSPNPGGSSRANFVYGAAALSSRDAWAVGDSFKVAAERTLVLCWDGTAWHRLASPSPRDAELFGVAASSPRNAWAVGDYSGGTLILRWNGAAWKRVASPNPGGSPSNSLRSVTVLSSRDAWAVGYNTATNRPLVLQWDGTAWSRLAIPTPRFSLGTDLDGVAATSLVNAWAVGYYYNGRAGSSEGYRTLVLRWDGTAWKRVASPNVPRSGENYLNAVTAASPASAWAVGDYFIRGGTADRTLMLRWDGTAWKRVASPDPGTADNFLRGVAAASPANAWAVGEYDNFITPVILSAHRTLILHWDGTAWKRVASPNPGGSASDISLQGVAAASPGNAWAVGYSTTNGIAFRTLTLHCGR